MQIDKDKPFATKEFLDDVKAAVLGTSFKLYGKIPAKFLENDLTEIDFNMGKVHLTEVDFKALSEAIARVNEKYGTSVTYCVYHTDQFPGCMLLNIRGPAAPKMLDSNIRF